MADRAEVWVANSRRSRCSMALSGFGRLRIGPSGSPSPVTGSSLAEPLLPGSSPLAIRPEQRREAFFRDRAAGVWPPRARRVTIAFELPPDTAHENAFMSDNNPFLALMARVRGGDATAAEDLYRQIE